VVALRELAKKMLLENYPPSYVAEITGFNQYRVSSQLRRLGGRINDDMPPVNPTDCPEHGERIWSQKKNGCWRVYCKGCKRKANNTRDHKKKTKFMPLTEEAIKEIFNGRKFEDDPGACQTEGWLKW